ncbi:MAG: addiction module protein [Pirellulales bacterium]
MSTNFDSFVIQAMSLPLTQRYELAQRLWDSIEGQVDEDAELIAEFERRCAEVDSDNGRTYSHEEVMREAKKAAGE